MTPHPAPMCSTGAGVIFRDSPGVCRAMNVYRISAAGIERHREEKLNIEASVPATANQFAAALPARADGDIAHVL